MGTHGAATARSRSLPLSGKTIESVNVNLSPTRWLRLGLSGWPVARRLFTVIVAALLMGLVFGGLQAANAESSASQFGQTQQLAKLSVLLINLVNALENERDTVLLLSSSASEQRTTMAPLFAETNAAVAAVQQTASGLGGLPGNIQSDVNTVLSELSPSRIQGLHATINSASSDTSVIASYGSYITFMITLVDQVGQGVSDASLVSDVEALNALALAKDQASQQRALLNSAFTSPVARGAAYRGTSGASISLPTVPTADPATEQALTVAYDQEFSDVYAFYQAASPAQAQYYINVADLSAGASATQNAQNIEENVFSYDDTDYLTNNGETDTGVSVPGSQLIPSLQGIPLLKGPKGSTLLRQGLATWELGMDDQLTAMQSTETLITDNIADRVGQLYQSAHRSALTSIVITVVVLLFVLLAALAVARSVVLPLRRLRIGALDIASVQLPERVRLLTDSLDAVASMDVEPIDVDSADEIGEVARAFDQVHSEAVRLAGEQALLRSSFNAMFVNLSRRSQTLIERLARMIDNLEQNEDDPDRLGSLFSMDHLVTRMRRNSENLLLLAGHENARKWSETVPLADIARAATSEIEQYNRVTLNIQPGISVTGKAVSDVVHLLAELVENATTFSPKDTQVHVGMQELTSGGVLIEVIDKGIGVSEARLGEMNSRLDNPPTIDVSVSRHMGLFAVARLAKRHRIRVRLRPAAPQGLSALVWLPDSVIERTDKLGPGTSSWPAQPPEVRARAAAGAGETAALTSGGGGSVGLASDHADVGQGNETGSGSAEGQTASGWFRGGRGGAGRFLVGEPVIGDQRVSKSGLPTRTPGSHRAIGIGSGTTGSGKTLPKRSPEHVRSRLAGFQRGTRRAEGAGGSGGQPPRSEEGTES
jgi:signal transduction histidine kinase